MLKHWFPTSIYNVEQIIDDVEFDCVQQAALRVCAKAPNSTSWLCNTYNTMHSCNLVDVKDFDTLHQYIMYHVRQYTSALGAVSDDLYISQSWINVAGRGDYQEVHCHPDSVISGVYYLQVPVGSPSITFYNFNNIGDMCTLRYSNLNELNYANCSYEPVENSLILFRSYVQHAVKVMQVDGQRISISFNTKYR